MEATAQIKKNARFNFNSKVNLDDLGDPAFEEAFSICTSIFHNQINQYKSIGFNYSKFRSIKATVHSALKIYDITVFRALNDDMIRNHTSAYGTFVFSPNTFLRWLKDCKEKFDEQAEKDIPAVTKIGSTEDKKLQSVTVHSLIPEIFDDKRVRPNVFLRSALFGVIKPGKRKYVENLKVHSMGQYEVYFTGKQLDQNDLEVWDEIIYLSKIHNSIDIVKVSLYDMCKYLEITYGSQNREAIRDRIKRLKAGCIEIKYASNLYFGNLINDVTFTENKGKFSITLNKKLLSIFTTKDYTLSNKKIRKELGTNQLARWLFHFYETHKEPIPFQIEYLKRCCGSESSTKEYTRILKVSLELIKKAYEKYDQNFNYKIKNTELFVYPLNTVNNMTFLGKNTNIDIPY